MRIPRTLLVPTALAATLAFAIGCQKTNAHASDTAGPVPEERQGAPSTAGTGAPAPFATPPVADGMPDIATLVAKVKPSVVAITTVHEGGASSSDAPQRGLPWQRRGGRGRGDGSERGSRGGGEGDSSAERTGLGSGILTDAEGHVVTNAHVVEGADTVRVRLLDNREFDAKVLGRDALLDLAVLKIQGASGGFPAASFGSSEATRVGEYAVAIGHPFGLSHTVTLGIVSAKGRSIHAGPYDDYIQTDASINPGNSGGPLFNLRGQVIGINTAIDPNGKGIGFAVPIDVVKDALPQLLARGKIARGYLGVSIREGGKLVRRAPPRARRARSSPRCPTTVPRRRRASARATSSCRSTARRCRAPRNCRRWWRATPRGAR